MSIARSWNCSCGGEFEHFDAEPDIGISAGYICVDCSKEPDDDDEDNRPAYIDPDEYVPECER